MAKLVQDYPAHCNPISAVEDFKEFFLCSKETLLGATLGLAAGREKANFLATSRDEIEDPFFFIDPAVSFSCEIGSIKLHFPSPRKRNPAIRNKKEDVTPSSMWEIVCFSFEVRGRRTYVPGPKRSPPPPTARPAPPPPPTSGRPPPRRLRPLPGKENKQKGKVHPPIKCRFRRRFFVSYPGHPRHALGPGPPRLLRAAA